MTISADNFWIELDRLLGAPTTAAQMEALMESYGLRRQRLRRLRKGG